MSVAENIKDKNIWQRGFFILLFTFIYLVAAVVVCAVVVFQFGSKLLEGHTNPRLLDFAQQLSTFLYEVLRFITFKSDDMPYPFEDWPSGPPD